MQIVFFLLPVAVYGEFRLSACGAPSDENEQIWNCLNLAAWLLVFRSLT